MPHTFEQSDKFDDSLATCIIDPSIPIDTTFSGPIQAFHAADAGIDDKYFGDTLANLPRNKTPGNKPKVKPKYNLKFEHLSEINASESTSSSSAIPEYKVIYDQLYDFSYYSRRGEINADSKVVFIHAGRGENALLPRPDANCRVVLVATQEEYAKYAASLHSQLEVLVINKMNSSTHGDYQQHLGTINARRLAVLLFSFHYKLHNCLCLDDNIEKILTNEQHTISDIYEIFENKSRANKQIITGLATISNVSKNNDQNEFCAKVHFWDFAPVFGILQNATQLFYFALPAKDSANCCEDFYQQLVLKNLSRDPNITACRIISSAEMGIKRSPKNKNICKNKGAQAQKLLEAGVLDFSNPAGHDYYMFPIARASADTLKQIVRKNFDRYQAQLNTLQTADLIKEHAKANKITASTLSSAAAINTAPFGESWFNRLSTNLPKLDFLLKHQKLAIEALGTRKSSHSKFILATGTGKTMLQIALALNALSLNHGKPIIIVTPTMDLVEQFFADFHKVLPKFTQAMPDSFSAQDIIQVDSGDKHIAVNVLKMNKTLRNKSFIAIFCLASYMQMLKSPECDYLQQAPLLLLDEYHTYPADQLQRIKANVATNNSLLYGFTATPPANDIFTRSLFTYTRQQAENDGIIVPLKIHKFESDYDIKLIDGYIQSINNILEVSHPNGGNLHNKKVIIYMPDIKYIKKLHNKLTELGKLDVYEIHSGKQDKIDKEGETKTKRDKTETPLDQFRSNKNPCIAIACRQLRVGFSDPNVDAVIYLQGGKDANDVTQVAGRVLRKDDTRPDKKGLLVVFKDANLAGLEEQVAPTPILFSSAALHEKRSPSSSSASSSESNPKRLALS